MEGSHRGAPGLLCVILGSGKAPDSKRCKEPAADNEARGTGRLGWLCPIEAAPPERAGLLPSLRRCPWLRLLQSCQACLLFHKKKNKRKKKGRQASDIPGYREAPLQYPCGKAGEVKTELLHVTQRPACPSWSFSPCYHDS